MPRIKHLLVAAAILALAAVLGACGGSDDSQPTAEVEVTPAANIAEQAPPKEEEPAPAEEEEQAPAAKKKPAGEKVAVDIKDFAFAPQALKVKVGDTVEFTNSDSAPHTATATSGSDFDSGNLSQGAKFEWKADKAGSVEYICAIHPSMTGTIQVN
jgi:plastocyanin